MYKSNRITLLFVLVSSFTFCQNLSQTIRGTIIDADSKLPLSGAEIIIIDSNPIQGAVSDDNGVFKLENVALGRTTLRVTYLGYEPKAITNLVINSGKEFVITISLQESLEVLDEVVLQPYRDKIKAKNEMALISSRSISPEETKRFAGGWDDPSRILSNFAGVTNTQNSENDIIVRGNSPKYIQWRLEGMEIANPTHFGDQNGAKGGISALNNNLLATSDFYTGAFSAEYGDVLSGVYDVQLRAGNNEVFEATFGFGALGTDVTLEGPFNKGYKGSYLVNYRYSTVTLINELGLIDVQDTELDFQDLTFKMVFPTKSMGTFSIYGLGGLSGLSAKDVKPSDWNTPGDEASDIDINEDYDKDYSQYNMGLNHSLQLNDKSTLKTAFTYSINTIKENVFQYEEDTRKKSYISDLDKNNYRVSMTYNNKLNSKSTIQAGSKYALFNYKYDQRISPEFNSTDFETLVDFNESIGTLRNFISWKYRLNNNIILVSGIHNMNVLHNDKTTVEPRLAINWKVNNSISFSLGYGKHSSMESVHNYFAKTTLDNGAVVEPNKDLDLLKANHYVLGFQKRISENLHAKIEVYYQDLYNLPVENNVTSSYATINESTDFRYVDLVNKGTGENYGLELTLERFFTDNYYYLINGSVYNSKYKALDGKERNTLYNGNYLVNVLFGKEFVDLGKKDNQTLALNTKVFFGGGQKYIPLLRDPQGNLAVNPETNNYFDYSKSYEDKLDDIFQLTISASYKFNRPKATHEIFLNLDNVSNSKGKINEYYDESEPNSIGYTTQFGFFPNLMYRVYF